MEEFLDIEPSSCIFYHSLCELKHEEVRQNSNERILTRKNIKLLTYNIFLRPPPVKNNENDWKDERLEDFCKLLHNFDIICLQEMFGMFNSRKQSLIRAATKAGFFFYVDTSSPSFVSKYMVDGGLVILSRFPIVSYSFVQFRYGVIADSLAQKGVLYSKILVKDCFLHLFTSHLQASYFDSGESHFIISCETRMAQLKQINYTMSEILKSEYHKRDKVLLVGDFNVDAQRYSFKRPECLAPEHFSIIEREYDDMLEALNDNGILTRDVFQFYKKFNPITYGDVDPETGVMETCLTHIEDLGSRQSLDYIFECYIKDEYDLENPIPKKRLLIDPDKLKVEKFLSNQISVFNGSEKNKKGYTQLSDHYGLSCEIVYESKKLNFFKQYNFNLI